MIQVRWTGVEAPNVFCIAIGATADQQLLLAIGHYNQPAKVEIIENQRTLEPGRRGPNFWFRNLKIKIWNTVAYFSTRISGIFLKKIRGIFWTYFGKRSTEFRGIFWLSFRKHSERFSVNAHEFIWVGMNSIEFVRLHMHLYNFILLY